jgi:hypothetical protein
MCGCVDDDGLANLKGYGCEALRKRNDEFGGDNESCVARPWWVPRIRTREEVRDLNHSEAGEKMLFGAIKKKKKKVMERPSTLIYVDGARGITGDVHHAHLRQ